MTQRTPRAGAPSFAHLFGIGPRAANADEQTDPKDKGAKGKKAADPKDDTTAEEPETEEVTNEGVDKEDKPDLGDVEDPDDSIDEDAAPEEDDSDPKVRKAAKSGRKAERARWAKVLGSSAAAGRGEAALTLLATTTLGSKAIASMLATLPVAAAPSNSGRNRLDARMAERPNPKVGADAPAAATDFGGQVKAAMSKVRSAR